MELLFVILALSVVLGGVSAMPGKLTIHTLLLFALIYYVVRVYASKIKCGNLFKRGRLNILIFDVNT